MPTVSVAFGNWNESSRAWLDKLAASPIVSELLLVGASASGLKPGDPLTVGLADALLAAVAIFASLLPALRAARLEPMVALREE